MSDRTIAVVTGTRADYGLLSSSMAEIERREGLELAVVATGMHLSTQYGHTVDEIRADGFTVDREVDMLLDSDTERGMAKSLGVGLASMADVVAEIDPDILLVLGDRDEAFAAGVAAAHMNVPVAHIHGGDAMQGAVIDDSIRHALTKFAHLHFPASAASAERVERLGEEPWRIETVGAPGLDDVLAETYEAPTAVRSELDLRASGQLTLVVQHPVTTQVGRAGEQMQATLDALDEVEGDVVVIYPNADAGGRRMIEAIERHSLRDRLHVVENLPRRRYLGLLAAADVMVGNSSSAIIEAPSFDLPVVDIGPRQEGRERVDCVCSVPHETSAIAAAVERCLTDETFRDRVADCTNPYDYGGAGENIVDRLATVDVDDRLRRKRITY